MLIEISQAEKDKYCMSSLKCEKGKMFKKKKQRAKWCYQEMGVEDKINGV